MPTPSLHSLCRWTFHEGVGRFVPSGVRPAWGPDRLSTVDFVHLVQDEVALRLPDNGAISGRVKLASSGSPSKVAHPFTFDPSQFEEATAEDFEKIRKLHYARLALSPIPGGEPIGSGSQ